MSGTNDSLHHAKQAKNDEFYTQLSDIEAEMSHYRPHFVGKTIFCNCDDPTESNFWRYFHTNFTDLGLKRLVSTHFDHTGNPTYRMDYTGGDDLHVEAGVRTELECNGDFRSEECIRILQESDIVVTNPPFSKFREYIDQLMEYEKKFIIIGSKNCITYKKIFPLIQNNQLWIGAKPMSGSLWFETPDGYVNKNDKIIDGIKYTPIACCWFTNLDIPKRHDRLMDAESVHKHYEGHEDAYPRYDNYNAINVDKVVDIPDDYWGYMGAPITFLDKYNPDEFEIVDANDIRKDKVYVRMKPHGLIKDKEATITVQTDRHESSSDAGRLPYVLTGGHTCINGKRKYARILIRRIS